MLVRDVMNREVEPVPITATFRDAARRLGEASWSEVPVVDHEGSFVGVLAVGDLLRALMPDVDELARQGASLETAFDAFLQQGHGLVDQAVARLVIRDPIVISPDDPLLRVAIVMLSRQIHRLFAVEDGVVVGTVGRAEICIGVLQA